MDVVLNRIRESTSEECCITSPPNKIHRLTSPDILSYTNTILSDVQLNGSICSHVTVIDDTDWLNINIFPHISISCLLTLMFGLRWVVRFVVLIRNVIEVTEMIYDIVGVNERLTNMRHKVFKLPRTFYLDRKSLKLLTKSFLL